jgi:UDP-GlcNAc:undecaprenyl-phosphate GlcNAc-1-phosphate transferase
MVGGYIDDRHDIGYYSLFFVLAAVLTVLPFDIGVTQITNPFGGVFSLDWLTIPVFSWGDVFYTISLWVDVFTIAWLLSMTYATKLLDGLDGLVSGLLLIGSFVIFLLSTSAAFLQPEVAMLAITLAGASLGFLIFNWNPASIFLGEGGSVFAGFMLGILAIISGGKIATALLIMGIPLLDLIWVIGRRLMHGKSIVAHDAQHVHHRLLKSGFTQKQAVIILYTLSFSFGITTLFLQSMHKLVTLGVLVFVMILLGIFLVDKTE